MMKRLFYFFTFLLFAMATQAQDKKFMLKDGIVQPMRVYDSAALATSIAAKLNKTDTAAMLSPYSSLIAAMLKYTDTAGMLSAYQTAINGKQAAGSYLIAGNNLADVSNTTTARTNLGLGTLATQNGSFGTGVLTALAINVGSTGAFQRNNDGFNGTVGATTPTTGAFTTATVSTSVTSPVINGGTAANDDITIQGTTNATRTSSYVILQPTAGSVGIGTTSPTTKLQLGNTNANGSSNVLLIGHNGTTSSSSNGTYTLGWYSQFGNIPFTMGAEGNGYDFKIRQTNGGQGTFLWDFGTISSKFYSTEYKYITDHYEQIFTGKWLTTSSGSASNGDYYGISSSVFPNSFTLPSDVTIISRANPGGYYVTAQDPIVTLFEGTVGGTKTVFNNRVVSRFNRMGYLGIGTEVSWTNGRQQQAMLTLDNPTFTGYSNDGTTVAKVVTSGSSTSATFLNTPNGTIGFGIHIGSKITANGVTRTVTAIAGANSTVTLDAAVNWDNSGTGYTYTFNNPFISLQDSATKYMTVDKTNFTTSLNVGIGTTSPDASAIIDASSTAKGFLPPRMTNAQKGAIASPATGLTVYCTDCTATDASIGVMQTYNGTTWKNNW